MNLVSIKFSNFAKFLYSLNLQNVWLFDHINSQIHKIAKFWFHQYTKLINLVLTKFIHLKVILSGQPMHTTVNNVVCATYIKLKPERFESASSIFEGTNIQITSQGECHLGATVGSNYHFYH